MPSAILTIDAPARMTMPKKADNDAGEFRSMLERVVPSLRKPDTRGAEESGGAQALIEPPPVAAEGSPAADEAEAEAGSADDERMTPETRDAEADSDAPAPPHSVRAIDDLRLMLAGSARKSAKDDAASGAKPKEPVPADADAPTQATGKTRPHAAETSAVVPAAATKPAPAKSSPMRPVEPVAVDAADTRATADGAGPPPARPVRRTGDRDGSGDPRQDANRRGQGEAKLLPGVTVVVDGAASGQPASQPATRAIVATLGADPSWAAYFRAKPEPAAQSAPQSLTIQLRPAELGVVTAHLRFTGDQVAVELQAETPEARRQLAADTDTIARSLRAAGLEVDQVTVQPAPQAQDAGRGVLPGRGDGAGGGTAFASQEGAGERSGKQAGSNGSQDFATQGGGDDIRTGAGGADRDGGRYI